MVQVVPSQCAVLVAWRAESPTAHTSFGAIAVIPQAESRPPGGVGEGDAVQDAPSQCSNSNSMLSVEGSRSYPAAQISSGPVPETLVKMFAERRPWAGFGLGTMLQLVPSKCSISVRSPSDWELAFELSPTAHTSEGLSSRTPWNQDW